MSEALVKPESADSLISIIDRVVCTGELTADKVAVLERLLAMQMTIREEERKASFAAAMCRLQAKLPQISKAGTQFNTDRTVRNHYELIEDIDVAIRPMYTAEGFSISYDEEDLQGNMRKFSATLLHSDGHSKTVHKTMPFDASKFRSDGQSEKSTVSLARRTLLMMQFNLVGRGEDDDGQGGSPPITEDQARDIETMLVDTKSNRAVFYKYFRIESVAQLLASDFNEATNMLETRMRAQKEPKQK